MFALRAGNKFRPENKVHRYLKHLKEHGLRDTRGVHKAGKQKRGPVLVEVTRRYPDWEWSEGLLFPSSHSKSKAASRETPIVPECHQAVVRKAKRQLVGKGLVHFEDMAAGSARKLACSARISYTRH